MARGQLMALYNFIVDTGTIVPDTSEILSEVQQEYRNVFGQDLNVNPETPQGILINSEALARSSVADNNASLANQINPNIAGGIFLDAICALTGLARTPASFTTVIAELTGIAETTIPTSIVAVTTTGFNFSPVAGLVIGSTGTVSGEFRCLVPGPINCAVGDLNRIASGVPGWEQITNNVAGTLGANTQSDLQLRRLRQQTLALQGQALPEAITSALNGSGLTTSLTFQENVTNSTVTLNGVSMIAHSVYVCATNSNPVVFMQIVANVTGTAGTIIPTNAIASDGTHRYSPVTEISIQSDGTGLGVFQANSAGTAQTVGAADLTTIVTAISGWSTVTNTYPSFAYDYTFLYDVASILLAKKSSGSAWSKGPDSAPYGPQNIIVTDPVSLQEYLVSFDVPTPIAVLAQVTVLVTPAFTGDPVTSVQNAIIDYALNGNAQNSGFIVGGDVSAWELSTAVNLAYSGLFITLLEISYAISPSFGTDTLAINIFEQATIVPESITVIVNYPAGYSLV